MLVIKGDRVGFIPEDHEDVDWVTVRSTCSATKLFDELLAGVEKDVDARNGLRPEGEDKKYKFRFRKDGAESATVALEGLGWQFGGGTPTVKFDIDGTAIAVTSNILTDPAGAVLKGLVAHQEIFSAKPEMTVNGHCRLAVDGVPFELWHVRQRALDRLLFHPDVPLD
jgi:hypothetical protein